MRTISNKGQFKYGNKIAEKWDSDFILKELDKLIRFLEKDPIIDSNLLSISMLLLESKSAIKTEKQFDYIKQKFKDNDTVSGSLEMIKNMMRNRWVINGAKGKINSNITKLVLINNYSNSLLDKPKEEPFTITFNKIYEKNSQ